MLDISFSEIAVIGAVALVVLGPERLPKVARTAGHLFGRLQRYVNGVKADIAREMETSELSKIKQEVQDAARSFEQTVQKHASEVESEAKLIQTTAEKTGTDAVAKTTDTALPNVDSNTPATVEMKGPGETETIASGTTPLTSLNPLKSAPVLAQQEVANAHGQGLFDFGIEPSRPYTDHSRPASPSSTPAVI